MPRQVLGIGTSGASREGLETDRLDAFVEYRPTELGQALVPRDNGQEMVACELARLAGEAHRPVGEQNLGLADTARIEDQLSRHRVARGVLGTDAEIERSQRHPYSLATPAHVHDLACKRKRAHESRARLRRRIALQPRHKGEPAGRDGQIRHRCPFAELPTVLGKYRWRSNRTEQEQIVLRSCLYGDPLLVAELDRVTSS